MTDGPAPHRRLAIAGVFDIANYGDQLFPLIAIHRLASQGVEVEAVAPAGRLRLRPDARTPRDLTWLMTTEEEIHAVLIGGGNILYNLRVDYAADARIGESHFGQGQHTGLWLGAALAAAMRDIPFGFNAPGIPYPFSRPVARDVLKPVLDAADIAAVRDEASAVLARAAEAQVHVVPDTAIDIADMWPRHSLDPALGAFAARSGWSGAPHVAVHLRAGPDEGGHIREVARELDRFCTDHALEAVIIAIGDDLGDGQTAVALRSAMTVRTHLLDGSATLREVAAAIAQARLYLGGSLHGYITAAAYGVPGVITTTRPHRKFGGFLEWMERPEDLARSWSLACEKGAAHLQAGLRPQVPPRLRAGLDQHWQAVAGMLRSPTRRAPERAALLRALTARAGAQGGMAWLLQPFLRPAAGGGTP